MYLIAFLMVLIKENTGFEPATPVNWGRYATDCAIETYLEKRTQLAHKSRQVPSMKEGRLELERDAKYRNYHVSQRQIPDIYVNHSVHPTSRICQKR